VSCIWSAPSLRLFATIMSGPVPSLPSPLSMISEPPKRLHRCLEITEITEIIFDFVYDTAQDRFSQASTFFNLATTCKAFNEPAVKFLWKDLWNFWPIKSIFPDQVWRIEDGEQDDNIDHILVRVVLV
jgi:hypothetical protein